MKRTFTAATAPLTTKLVSSAAGYKITGINASFADVITAADMGSTQTIADFASTLHS